MNTDGATSWQAVRDEVLRRIREREWKPGDRIPHEADLARELGCARATVNRALRAVAEDGLIERRRRAGSRVALHPVRKARLDIPVIRVEVESRGLPYHFSLTSKSDELPPPAIRARMKTAPDTPLMHVVGLHMAGGRPHALEDRWIDADAVPGVRDADFSTISPNEWLVLNVPFEGGDIAFSATTATREDAAALDCAPGAALFLTERTTWHGTRILTTVRLLFAPGYRLHTEI
ncbi:GntR family transcriptional regulator [Jhaorihella thermophila]|uniref:GntR family transcriptional regulator, histidine utilization repressor n=1 Tax=Jhaorihella thermophila TaxID=488547 RepID=A0A1H5T7W7_9RHOB|nr:GntR family transcriptional regulator [Jhaorihella thermophila]SEF58191.1 GntR family transcriptional regulator, histidine utilization repressor [Jhaorihella thermophila]